MSALHDRFDAAEIFALASVNAISVEDARNQLQRHIAVDVMIEGFDQRSTDSIMAEGCAIPRLFLERTLARLPPTLSGAYFAAMIACDETPVRCEKQSPEAPPFKLEVQTRAPTARLPPEYLPLPESASTPAPLPPSSSARTYSPISPILVSARTSQPIAPIFVSTRTFSPIAPILVSARTSLPIAPILVSARTSSPIAPILVSARTLLPIAPILVSAQKSQPSSPIPPELRSPTSLHPLP